MRQSVKGALSGHARPSDALLGKLGRAHGPALVAPVQEMLDDAVCVDALSALLDKGMAATTNNRDLAAFLLRHMKENQR